MSDWEQLAEAVREAKLELLKAEVAWHDATEMLNEARLCFNAAKGALIECALGPLVDVRTANAPPK
jgi:hypothetical protein